LQESYCSARRALESYVLDPAEVEVLYELPLLRMIALYERGTPLRRRGTTPTGGTTDALLVAKT
jgi:hypothetical protein